MAFEQPRSWLLGVSLLVKSSTRPSPPENPRAVNALSPLPQVCHRSPPFHRQVSQHQAGLISYDDPTLSVLMRVLTGMVGCGRVSFSTLGGLRPG